MKLLFSFFACVSVLQLSTQYVVFGEESNIFAVSSDINPYKTEKTTKASKKSVDPDDTSVPIDTDVPAPPPTSSKGSPPPPPASKGAPPSPPPPPPPSSKSSKGASPVVESGFPVVSPSSKGAPVVESGFPIIGTTYTPTWTPTGTWDPTYYPTSTPTDAPTITPCEGTEFNAKFSAPVGQGEKAMKARFKGTYTKQNKVSLSMSINFGDWSPKKVTLAAGDLLDYSINTKWEGNPDAFGWNNKCRTGRVGEIYDPTVACGPDSENIVTVDGDGNTVPPSCFKDNGRQLLVSDYDCPAGNKKKNCMYGDMSGKNGQLVVFASGKGYPKVTFKDVDNFFPKKKFALANDDAGTPWSIVISKDGEPFLCAEFNMICDNK